MWKLWVILLIKIKLHKTSFAPDRPAANGCYKRFWKGFMCHFQAPWTKPAFMLYVYIAIRSPVLELWMIWLVGYWFRVRWKHFISWGRNFIVWRRRTYSWVLDFVDCPTHEIHKIKNKPMIFDRCETEA